MLDKINPKRLLKLKPKFDLALVGLDGKNVMVSPEDTLMVIDDTLYLKTITMTYKPLKTKYDFVKENSNSFDKFDV